MIGLGDKQYHIETVIKFMSITMMSSGRFYSDSLQKLFSLI